MREKKTVRREEKKEKGQMVRKGMEMKELIKKVVIGSLIVSQCTMPVQALPNSFLFNFQINHEKYGKLTAILPEVMIKIYDDQDQVIWEKMYQNVKMEDGFSILEIEVEDAANKMKGATKVGVEVEEFGKEELREIFIYPHTLPLVILRNYKRKDLASTYTLAVLNH